MSPPLGDAVAAAPFERSAAWYDVFNRGKDYDAEVASLLERLRRWAPAPTRWLDVGCGTGRHLDRLRARGLVVAGVEASSAMATYGRAVCPEVPIQVGTAQSFTVEPPHDVISLLFHVMSYQVTDALVVDAFRNVRRHLAANGVLVFDFWHTGGVLQDPPTRRVREATVDGRRMVRVAVPREDRPRRLIEVEYEFRWDSADGELVAREQHELRHFRCRELETFLAEAGLEMLGCEGWTSRRPVSDADWYGLVFARRGPTSRDGPTDRGRPT